MEESTGCETRSTNNKEDIECITEGISQDLVFHSRSNNFPTQGASSSVIDLSETTSLAVNSVPCRDANCARRCRTQLIPLGYTPEPAPLKRVKFVEHSETHEIELDGHGKVTIKYLNYESEAQMKDIMSLITKDLSEPYSIYTYRYFIHNWPELSFLVSNYYL